MKNVFVETENVSRFHAALGALDRRGASEACLLVVDGRPGLGKTTALNRWAAQTGAVYVRAKAEWTAAWFLRDLLTELRVQHAHAYSKNFELALGALASRQSAMIVQKRTFAVVIDEADHISRDGRIMESIRDFSDLADIVFVLVGMGRIRDNLVRFPQIISRVAQFVRFDQSTREDVRRFLDTICEVPVADDLCDFVHAVTEGYNREIKECIATIERFGRRNGAGPDNPVRISDMAGQVICNARATGLPIIVPEI